MAILDINKNSLPEQVQENKENIAAIQTAMDDKASIDYVDEKDADTLQSAKDYSDDTSVQKSLFTKPGSLITSDNDVNPKEFKTDGYPHAFIVTNQDGLGNNGLACQSKVHSGEIDTETASSGQVLTSNGNHGASWQDPSIKAANIDSESETAGKVLQADGNGGAVWASASGGGGALTLLWSGRVAGGTGVALTDLADPLTNYKKVALTIGYGTGSSIVGTFIVDKDKINNHIGGRYSSGEYYILYIRTNAFITDGSVQLTLPTKEIHAAPTYSSATYSDLSICEIYGVN